MPPTEIKRQLRAGAWRNWGASVCPPLTEHEKLMTSIQKKHSMSFLDYTATHDMFVMGRVENKKAACDSIVVMWVDDGEIRSPYAGRLKNLMIHVPPWVTASTIAERDAQAEQIATVKWYEVKDFNAAVYNGPVVTRSFKSLTDGEYCYCKHLEPVPLSLLPYIGTAESPLQHWQVLTRDVTVFKPEIGTCLPHGMSANGIIIGVKTLWDIDITICCITFSISFASRIVVPCSSSSWSSKSKLVLYGSLCWLLAKMYIAVPLLRKE